MLIAGGGEPRVLERALAGEDRRDAGLGRGAPSGPHRATSRSARASAARWSSTKGRCAALNGQQKASLLPIGVVGVEGTFEKGDVVEIRDGSGRVHGRGLVNYAADACRKLAGRHSDDIDTILGWRGYDALITRDNLVMGAV